MLNCWQEDYTNSYFTVMQDFQFHNPAKIAFGQGSIARLPALLPSTARILLTYGGGSIRANGVYDQVWQALQGFFVVEFAGIEANPRYETLMRGVEIVRAKKLDYLLAVGGGSVVDGTKFIAAAACFGGADPWEILSKGARVESALPLGCVLTLPATGSEMNGNSVVSRESTQEKLAFGSSKVIPQFSILDPQTTFSLLTRQVANGIVDTFVHVMEQYMTFPSEAPLQDRQAEAILATLVEIAPRVLQVENPDYQARASLMWCATQALNGTLGCGVPQDWSTHEIGHEITAFFGLDHAQTLAVVLPGVWRHQLTYKQKKLAQYGRRIWGLTGSDAAVAEQAIVETEKFFTQVGNPVLLAAYGVDAGQAAEKIQQRWVQRGNRKISEQGNLGASEIAQIIRGR